jgi:hypothetical protein
LLEAGLPVAPKLRLSACFGGVCEVVSDALRDIMADLPETDEFVSRGSPTLHVRG